MNNTYNITMTRGDTYAFDTGMATDIAESIDAIYLSVKRRPTDRSYVFQKSFGDGIEKHDESTYRIRIAPEDTERLSPGKYVYDLEFTIGDDVYTVLSGTLKLVQDVTTNY